MNKYYFSILLEWKKSLAEKPKSRERLERLGRLVNDVRYSLRCEQRRDRLAEKQAIAKRIKENTFTGKYFTPTGSFVGKVITTVSSGRDCDHAYWEGVTCNIPATLVHWQAAEESFYSDAEGPCELRIKELGEEVEESHRDMMLEAYENGETFNIPSPDCL